MPNIDSNILYMNWLAHLLLAESDPEARLGNLPLLYMLSGKVIYQPYPSIPKE